MSIRVLSKVWWQSSYSGAKLLVLMALADRCSDEGEGWVGMKEIAHKARIEHRSAQRIVRQLKEAGMITITEGGPQRRANTYKINLEKLREPQTTTETHRMTSSHPAPPAPSPPAPKVAPKDDTARSGEDDTARTPDPSLTLPLDPRVEIREVKPRPSPTRPARDKPRDARLDHPALQAVRDLMGKYPNKDIWDAIISTLGENFDGEHLKRCWTAWRVKNYAPQNLGWVVDWYVRGIPPATNSNGSRPAPQTKADASLEAARQVAAKLRGEA